MNTSNTQETRTKLVVFKNHTLGYIFPELPNYCQILHASILKGASVTDGSVVIDSVADIRLATIKDFDTFRVLFTENGFGNENEYIYQKPTKF